MYQVSEHKDSVKIYGETNLGQYNIILEFPVQAIDILHEALHRNG